MKISIKDILKFTVPTYLSLDYEDLDILTNYDAEFSALKDSGNNGGGGGGGGGQQQGKTKQGFSAGSGLRSIAEGSSNAANDAVNNQDAAGHQAAYVAKNTLAQAAAGVNETQDLTIIYLIEIE